MVFHHTFYAVGEEIPVNNRNKYQSLDCCNLRSTAVSRGRLSLIFSLFMAGFLILLCRLFYLTVMSYQPIQEEKNQQVFALQRADIIDRNGILLATDLPIVDLFLDGKFVQNPEEETRKLLTVLPELDYNKTLRKFKSRSRFKYVKRNLTPKEQYDVNHLGLPSLNFSTREKRIYPHGALFAHVLGLTDIDNNGLSGVEKSFNNQLLANKNPLQLSVDVNVQMMVHETLSEYAQKFSATGASAVVLDVETQEVISLVSLPDYNPNSLETASREAFFNKPALGIYESGSVMKLFAVALGLESGVITPDDKIDASKPYRLANYPISDYRGKNRELTVPEVLIHSSNIGSSKIALMAGSEKQKAFMGELGFLEPLNFELPEKARPIYPKTWRDINTATISYGYGLSASPLHVLSGMVSLINGGFYRSPTFLVGGNTYKPLRQVISQKNSDALRHMMRAVVDIGSGKKANVKGYLVGGKTGSAEMQDEHGRYIPGSLRTSFLAAFPMNKPKYALMVMLENPKKLPETYGFNTAGWNSVPCGGEIIQKIAPYLGIAPQGESEKPAYIRASYIINNKKP